MGLNPLSALRAQFHCAQARRHGVWYYLPFRPTSSTFCMVDTIDQSMLAGNRSAHFAKLFLYPLHTSFSLCRSSTLAASFVSPSIAFSSETVLDSVPGQGRKGQPSDRTLPFPLKPVHTR